MHVLSVDGQKVYGLRSGLGDAEGMVSLASDGMMSEAEWSVLVERSDDR